ncbi:uncharacterized protein K452DRAFT_65483 [Aplosporella prunicola CBS 121167]|uniref:Alcohol acetyltransferase n=1 Tax=Aplosporella prunicola CBS 121167 TaxID=1176127 RepID=A0A6A6BUD3_9PEZI|nr:uncharacterized protein K452DRAFT_65483 [Aplosporella prunicola CBS 121167]KAF2146417.1 hypothetical protein K452DRAFT_65483 [Aplosporella prunicola CBS 121167]
MARDRGLSTAAPVPLRAAGRNEKRCIIRHALGFYRALIITGLYSTHDKVNGIETFIPAVKHCLSTHSILSAAIKGHDTEEPEFVRPPLLNLRNHIRIIEPACVGHGDDDELSRLKHVLGQTHDQVFENCHIIPPWRIVILPLHADSKTGIKRFYIAFAFSHSHGDGVAGLAFHRTFVEGLQGQGITTVRHGTDPRYQTSDIPLLPPLEELVDLQISNSYLIKPVLGAYLPRFVSGILGIEASTTPQAADMWRGKPASYNENNFHTGMELAIVKDDTLQKVLKLCREKETKFTGLLHQVIVRALSEALPPDAPAKNFVAQTAVDLRGMISGVTKNDMALCNTVEHHLFPRDSKATKGRPRSDSTGIARESVDPRIWERARETTKALAARATTLEDHPVGLLKYLNDFRKWMTGQIGRERDSSYELSNVMCFDPDIPTAAEPTITLPIGRPPTRSATTGSAPTLGKPGISTIFSPPQSPQGPPPSPIRRTASMTENEKAWNVGRVIFSQPANAVGSPVSFNVVTRKDGDMVVALTWQQNVLGVRDEEGWARKVCQVIKEVLCGIASGN